MPIKTLAASTIVKHLVVADKRYSRFFTTPETLEATGLSDRRLYYWVEKGYLESDHKQPSGSGTRWSFPYIDVLKFDLMRALTSGSVELMPAFAAMAVLNEHDLPFQNMHLATTPDNGWKVTDDPNPDDGQLIHIAVNLEVAVHDLDARIRELNQGVLAF